jgi:hypothetical protein
MKKQVYQKSKQLFSAVKSLIQAALKSSEQKDYERWKDFLAH